MEGPCTLDKHSQLENTLMKQWKCKPHRLSVAISLAILLLVVPSVNAQEESDIEVIDVTGKRTDSYGLMSTEDSSSAFGLDKKLYETPRSITEVSEDLVDKFALRSVDDLVRLTPGAFTSSFFGIKGAMDIRGEPADNYFSWLPPYRQPGCI